MSKHQKTESVYLRKTVIYKMKLNPTKYYAPVGEVIFDIVCIQRDLDFWRIQRESESTGFCRDHPSCVFVFDTNTFSAGTEKPIEEKTTIPLYTK